MYIVIQSLNDVTFNSLNNAPKFRKQIISLTTQLLL